MILQWPCARGEPAAQVVMRAQPEDFVVEEIPGFELSGDGEHVYLCLQKRELNTTDLQTRLSRLAQVPVRDIGFAGMKDRRAVTRQWFSVGLAGQAEPDWQALEQDGKVRVLDVARHRRKLRRGTHRGNRFCLKLRQLRGDKVALEERLASVERGGAPNYFGPQRFGRGGATLSGAITYAREGGKLSRARRGLYFSALRSWLFNQALAQRVSAGSWNTLLAGDVCVLDGSNSFFVACQADEETVERVRTGDVHPGVPLAGAPPGGAEVPRAAQTLTREYPLECGFLQDKGVELSWRASRLLAHDFSWQFCEDDSLQMDFVLGTGSYATALLAECMCFQEGG